MGHRALVAYEREDGLFNVHYTHWGAIDLRLRDRITPEDPYADGEVEEEPLDEFEQGMTLKEIAEDSLNYLFHEAFYVVDTDYNVEAYHTLNFNLHHDSDILERENALDTGALIQPRFYNGEPVSGIPSWFRGVRSTVADMVDRGVFTREEAAEYLGKRVHDKAFGRMASSDVTVPDFSPYGARNYPDGVVRDPTV